MAIETTDSPANANEYVASAAKTLGRSHARRIVFEAIYAGKKQVKSVAELMNATNLKRVRVLQEGAKLAANGIVDPEKIDGETAYRKRTFYQHHKGKILQLADNPHSLQKYPTKWTPKTGGAQQTITLRLAAARTRVRQITIDDIGSFSKVKPIKSKGNLPATVSEKQFKEGVQAIIGQRGTFKDWGGEKNDLFTTRVSINGKRRATAFGFKGPGTTGKLTPKKMGKNGDQIQRLFESAAEAFIVQYWREIDQSVLKQMEQLAIAKSVFSPGTEILYGIIDGEDSDRLYRAYKKKF